MNITGMSTSEVVSVVSAIILSVTAIIVIWQLNEMRKSTIAAAFATIISTLQKNEVREARRKLLTMKKLEFKDWDQKQIDNAEIVCSTYDIVGVLIKSGVVKHSLVTAHWHDSIIKCWEKSKPIIDDYRKKRGEDFWDDFEWLYKKSKEYEKQIKSKQ